MAQESSKSLLEKLDELPAKAADKLTELALKAYSAVSNKESMPANQKVFLDTFVDKNKGQITEKYFNEAELRALGNMIASKGGEKGSIRYDDYASFMKPSQTSGKAGVLKAGENPYESVRTTLGQFNYRKDPATQQYVVEDRYDFNRLMTPRAGMTKTPEDVLMMSDYVAQPEVINPANMNPYSALRLYAGRNMPEGQGRPVSVAVPKFKRGGEVEGQSSVTELIRTEAKNQGVDPDLAVRIAEQESRLDPTAKNPRSTAAGLFQLLEGTRKELGGDPNKRFDPLENARLGVRLIKENRGKLMTTLGREPEGHESYMAHLFGLRGASTLLKTDPNMPIEEAVKLFDPKRAKTIVKNNKLTGTVGDVIGNLRQKFGVKPVAKPAPQMAPVRKREPEGPVPFTTGFDFVVQAPSYQAALAMASLAELEDEKEDTEVAPEEETQTSSAQMLAGLQMPALQAFAKGGSADKEALVAPPVVVTPDQEPRPTGQARGMLDKLLGARKEVTGTLPGMAADIAASTVNPVYGTAASMADFETARREDDKLGMALSAMGLIPVAGGVIRGGGKMLQRIGKEGAESGGVFGSKEALKSSLGDFPAQVKQSWFDLTDEALYKDPVKMEKVLDDAARLDLFKEEQIKNAKEAIDLFKRKMIDEETLDTIMTRNITGPLTSVWTKLQKQLGHIEIDIPEPPKK